MFICTTQPNRRSYKMLELSMRLIFIERNYRILFSLNFNTSLRNDKPVMGSTWKLPLLHTFTLKAATTKYNEQHTSADQYDGRKRKRNKEKINNNTCTHSKHKKNRYSMYILINPFCLRVLFNFLIFCKTREKTRRKQ